MEDIPGHSTEKHIVLDHEARKSKCVPRAAAASRQEQLLHTHITQIPQESFCPTLFPKVFRANQKKKKNHARNGGFHFKTQLCSRSEEWGSLYVLLCWDKMTVGVFGAQCAQGCVAGASLRWFRLLGHIILQEGADVCATAINRRIWSTIILRLESLNSAQLLLKEGPPPLQPPSVMTHPCFMLFTLNCGPSHVTE